MASPLAGRRYRPGSDPPPPCARPPLRRRRLGASLGPPCARPPLRRRRLGASLGPPCARPPLRRRRLGASLGPLLPITPSCRFGGARVRSPFGSSRRCRREGAG